ncbi:MlaD family protein [Candidatus Omnitrophota bacterium]
MTDKGLELKVGVFAFIGLIVLTWAVFSISEIYIFSPGYLINVEFNFASGIDVGAPVRVAGVQSGEVKAIEMQYDPISQTDKIVLSVWLNQGVKVPADSRAYVNMLGLIGEVYLEVIPGEDYANLLQQGSLLVGRDPFSTETMMEAVHKVADSFDEVLGSVDDLLDQETRQALKDTVTNFRDFSDSLKVIAGRLERGEGKLGAWLKPRKKRTPKKEETKDKKDQLQGSSTQNF